MTSSTLPASQVRPPPWRDVRVLRWVGQIVVVVVVVGVLWWLYGNITANLRAARLPTGYGFLQGPYGVDIPGSNFRPSQSVWDAFKVGYGNTIRVIAFGIPACTIIGILIGIARLSENMLVRAFGTLYVETWRNVPVLLWILLLYGPVFTNAFPQITESANVFGLAILSNRGVWVPWWERTGATGVLLGATGLAILVAILLAAWRRRVNTETGQPARTGLFVTVAFLVIVVAGYFLGGSPLAVTAPTREGRLVTGGIMVFINYAALTVALTLYTASHVAEIVRGAILAVHRGQAEAANALALTTYQRYRFVILPQAFRIMIPPLASQYLNLTKNSSLAVAIGYFEITRVYQTVANNAAPQIQAVTVLMGLYLTFSLGISLVANLVNRRLQLETR